MPTSPSPIIVYAQACDLCRKMKIKCERTGDDCAHCIASSAECTFAPVERRPPKVKRPELLDSMEQRIERMEAILSATDLGSKSRASSPEEVDDDYELANQRSVFSMGPDGETRFTGPSSALSLLSPAGKKWVVQHTGPIDLDSLVHDSATSHESEPALTSDWFQTLSEEDRKPLPKKSQAVKYADAFFRHFNDTYPILEREAFIAQLDRMYTSRNIDDVTWYSFFNAVLAFGNYLHRADGGRREEVTQAADAGNVNHTWGYFRNAASNLAELMLRPNLMSIQALLIMALLLQRTSHNDPLSVLISAAAQMSHRMGLHTIGPASEIAANEIKQRSNVFWLLFILDQTVSVRTGCSSVLHEEDIGIRLPSIKSTRQPLSSPPDSPQSPRSPSDLEEEVNGLIFRYHCELAIQQNRVQRELYSPRSRHRSQLEQLTTITQIDSALQMWQQSMLPSVRPGSDFHGSDTATAHILNLHLAYFDTLNCLHRICPFNQAWFTGAARPASPQTSPAEGKGRVYASTSISTNAARRVISLLAASGETSDSSECNNGVLDGQQQHYLTSSALTLFAHAVSNAEDSRVQNDLGMLASFTSGLNQTSVNFIQSLHNIATSHITKTKSRTAPRSKRARGSDKPKPQPAKIHPKDAALRRSSVSTASRRQSQSHSPSVYASSLAQTPSSGQSPGHFPYAQEISYHQQQQRHVQDMMIAQQMPRLRSSSEAAMMPVEAASTAPPHMQDSYPNEAASANPYTGPVGVYGDTSTQMTMPNEWQLADPQQPHQAYPPPEYSMDHYSPTPTTNAQQVMDIHHPQPQHYNQGLAAAWADENNALGLWYEGSTSPEAYTDEGGCARQGSVDFGAGCAMDWGVGVGMQGQCHQYTAASATGLGGMERDMRGLHSVAERMVIM